MGGAPVGYVLVIIYQRISSRKEDTYIKEMQLVGSCATNAVGEKENISLWLLLVLIWLLIVEMCGPSTMRLGPELVISLCNVKLSCLELTGGYSCPTPGPAIVDYERNTS